MPMATAPSSYDELLYGRSMSLSMSEVHSGPECSICSEHYDDHDSDLIPRNLSCGHSMCSSEFSALETCEILDISSVLCHHSVYLSLTIITSTSTSSFRRNENACHIHEY